MKLYTLVLSENPDHHKASEWEFDRYWNITKRSQLDKIIKKIYSWTKYDQKGRVLCSGFPSSSASLQKRIFIVKMGHDKNMWSQKYPLGGKLIKRLD